MANKKISALALIAAASISATDVAVLVDADGVPPTTYKTTVAQLRTALLTAPGSGFDATDYLRLGGDTLPTSGMIRSAQGAITTDSPLINSTVTWNAVGVTFRHSVVNVTDTASAAGSLLADWRVGGLSMFSVSKTGTVTAIAFAGPLTGNVTGNVTGSLTGNVTGNVTGSAGSATGNAATATALQTARLINGVSFNGTADITVTAAAGTLTGGTLAAGVTTSSLTTVGTLVNLTVTNPIAGSITGNSATATKLATARAINGVNFDGSAAITVTAAAGTLTGATLAATVTASSLTSVGVLAAPHLTAPVVDSGGLAVTGVSSFSARLSVGNQLVVGAWDGVGGADGLLRVSNNTTTTATAGGQTLPGAPAGFLAWLLGATTVKVPYYNA